MKRKRNPATQFHMPGGHSRMHLTDGGVLDVAYGSTDWSRPGAAKRTLRILPTSTGHRGTLVRDLIGKDLSADALLAAAIEADESAEMMYDAYPGHVYRSAAHYYEGLSLGLLQLAGQLQGAGWRTNPRAKASLGALADLPVLRRLAKKHGGKVTRTKAPYWVEFPSRQKAEAFDMAAGVHGFFTETMMRPLAQGGTWCVPVRSRG